MMEWLTDNNTIAMAVVILCFVIGFLGSIVPVLPGTIITWAAIPLHIWLADESVSWGFFWGMTGLTVFGEVFDIFASYWGAKKFGATWRGGVGALIGGIIGMFFFPIGLIVGPIAGAVILELQGGREFKEAGRAGLGTIVGGIVAFFIKFGITCILIGGFFIALPEPNDQGVSGISSYSESQGLNP